MTGKDYMKAGAELVEQYCASVRTDLEAIPEARMWDRPVAGQVSPANLVLHLCGNLRHFFGHLLGGSDYIRERDREFQEELHLTKVRILETWEGACSETRTVLLSLDDAALLRDATVDKYPGDAPNHQLILRLLTHLSYHAGQIRTMNRLLVPPQA